MSSRFYFWRKPPLESVLDLLSFFILLTYTPRLVLLLSRLRPRWLQRYGEQRGGRNFFPDKNGHFELFRDEKVSGVHDKEGWKGGGGRLFEKTSGQSCWHILQGMTGHGRA